MVYEVCQIAGQNAQKTRKTKALIAPSTANKFDPAYFAPHSDLCAINLPSWSYAQNKISIHLFLPLRSIERARSCSDPDGYFAIHT